MITSETDPTCSNVTEITVDTNAAAAEEERMDRSAEEGNEGDPEVVPHLHTDVSKHHRCEDFFQLDLDSANDAEFQIADWAWSQPISKDPLQLSLTKEHARKLEWELRCSDRLNFICDDKGNRCIGLRLFCGDVIVHIQDQK